MSAQLDPDELERLAAGPDDTADPIPKAVATITAQIGKLSEDSGAVRTPEAVEAWRIVNSGDPAEFERLRDKAKRAGARVGQIDKDVKACVLNSESMSQVRPDPLVSLATGVEPSLDPLLTLSNSGYPLAPGSLIEENEKRGIVRVIESKAAAIIAEGLRGKVAWDGEAQTWLMWRSTHWESLTTAVDADKMLADAVHAGTDPLGYRPTYLNGTVQILQKRGLLAPPEPVYGVVPFANGLLDLDTGALVPATPKRALDWVLPHQYQSDAECPTIKAWLLRSVEGDQATVELLRAWLAALLRGMALQKFLLLLGRGGTGKGTFQRLALALIGSHNTGISTLRDLEENRFECAKLYGKRLCMINETGKHGGSLNMLKALTGGDHLPIERKNVQQTGSFVFGGLVLMATNEDLQSTDTTSGLERRRITVRFPKTATAEEKADWEKRGGEESILHGEMPGLIRWLLELSPAEIRERIESPPTRVVTDNILGMAAGNSIADWMIENTIPDHDAWAQIGDKREGREPGTGAVVFERSSDWLYANYLTWCLRSGRNRPVGLRKFKATVVDISETLGREITPVQHPQERTQGLKGIRLRQIREDARGWNPQSEALSHCFDSVREEREDKADIHPCIPENENITPEEVF